MNAVQSFPSPSRRIGDRQRVRQKGTGRLGVVLSVVSLDPYLVEVRWDGGTNRDVCLASDLVLNSMRSAKQPD